MSILTKKECDHIKKIINKYQKIDDKISKMEKFIESINNDKKILIKDLINIKRDESKFMTKLKNKYGEEAITPSKLIEFI